MSDYKPIDCTIHDQYEAAAVRRTIVTLTWSERDTPYVGRILDVRVRDGAEFLVLEGGLTVRLDHIDSFAPA